MSTRNINNWLKDLYRSCRTGAKKRNIPFEITIEEVEKIAKRAGGRCEVTGVVFNFKDIDRASKRPWMPSLDRKDSSKGYTYKNCRLVCVAANIALQDWGDNVLKVMCESMYLKLNEGYEAGYKGIEVEDLEIALQEEVSEYRIAQMGKMKLEEFVALRNKGLGPKFNILYSKDGNTIRKRVYIMRDVLDWFEEKHNITFDRMLYRPRINKQSLLFDITVY